MTPAQLSLASYLVAATLLAVLAVALLRRPATSASDRLFRLVVSAHAAWAASMAFGSDGVGPLSAGWVLVLEAIRNATWTVFLATLPAAARGASSGRAATTLVGARSIALSLAIGLAAASALAPLLGAASALVAILFVGAAVLGLVVLEQVHRNATEAQRWSIRFLSVGALATYGVDLMLYTQAVVVAQVAPGWWAARGVANAVVAPLLAFAAMRRPDWRIGLAFSHKIVFHSAALFGAGTYLVLAAVGSHYVGRMGGQWGDVAQAVLLFGAAIGLVFFALSGSLRARIRVLVAKHFFNYRYDYREEWLRLTRVLSTPSDGADSPELLSQRALRALASMVEATGGAMWHRDADRFIYVTGVEYEGPTVPILASDPVVRYLRDREWVIDIDEIRDDPARFPDMCLHPVFEASRAWLVVPLMLGDELLGIAVLTQPRAPFGVNWEVRDLLKTAGRQIASHLGVRRAIEQLVQARQFDSFNRMSAFVVHDLKNLVSQLSLLTGNASRHQANPEFQQDMLETVENVRARMQSLLRQLRAGTKPVEPPTAIALPALLRRAVESKNGAVPRPRLEIAPADRTMVSAHADRLERVIGHLIQNAIEACDAGGEVIVRVGGSATQVEVEVSDTGIGMSAEFLRTKLFKPFVSTKSHGMGIGTFESREYLREIGGDIEVASTPGAGTTFRVRLPVTDTTSARQQDLIDG